MTTRPEPGFSITPHTRSAITLKIAKKRIWKGTRQGVRIEIEHTRQLNFTRNPIKWKARIHNGWTSGNAPTVWQAIVEIEHAVSTYVRAHAEIYEHPKEER